MRHIGAVPRLLQIAVLAAAFVMPGWQAEAMDKQGQFRVLGMGTKSCGTWKEDKTKYENNSSLLFYTANVGWVLGYVTAFNHDIWHGVSVASETDANGMLGWIDNYCAANPTKAIDDAAEELVRFLSRGPHPNDK